MHANGIYYIQLGRMFMSMCPTHLPGNSPVRYICADLHITLTNVMLPTHFVVMKVLVNGAVVRSAAHWKV